MNATKRMRLTVNAMKIKSEELINFDSAKQTIGAQHIMVSDALRPSFPPARVNGYLYWD